jgi:hypothetical protein
MAAIDMVAAARSRHRVPYGGSSEAAEILAAFLRRSDVAFWHKAAFIALQNPGRYRTNNGQALVWTLSC